MSTNNSKKKYYWQQLIYLNEFFSMLRWANSPDGFFCDVISYGSERSILKIKCSMNCPISIPELSDYFNKASF